MPHSLHINHGGMKPIHLSITSTSGTILSLSNCLQDELNICTNFSFKMTILITCRVFMFADMQSGDSVIIKAQVSKSANRIPRNLRNMWNPQLSTFSTSWTDNASINGCIVCERGVGWKGAGRLKPLNGRLGSNWGRLMLDHCRQIWGYIGPG